MGIGAALCSVFSILGLILRIAVVYCAKENEMSLGREMILQTKFIFHNSEVFT